MFLFMRLKNFMFLVIYTELILVYELYDDNCEQEYDYEQ